MAMHILNRTKIKAVVDKTPYEADHFTFLDFWF